jgi:hypothetical protein
MQLLKLAISLTASAIFLVGCTSQPPQTLSSPTTSENPQTTDSTILNAAVKELQVLKAKIESGIDDRAYSVIITNTLPIVQKAKGEAKAVAAAKSALQGHQLALKLWQCDRIYGYEELHQCQDKALAEIFAKYPDIKAQAKVAVKGEAVATASTGLDKEAILKAIWKKTSADTEMARLLGAQQHSSKGATP